MWCKRKFNLSGNRFCVQTVYENSKLEETGEDLERYTENEMDTRRPKREYLIDRERWREGFHGSK